VQVRGEGIRVWDDLREALRSQLEEEISGELEGDVIAEFILRGECAEKGTCSGFGCAAVDVPMRECGEDAAFCHGGVSVESFDLIPGDGKWIVVAGLVEWPVVVVLVFTELGESLAGLVLGPIVGTELDGYAVLDGQVEWCGEADRLGEPTGDGYSRKGAAVRQSRGADILPEGEVEPCSGFGVDGEREFVARVVGKAEISILEG